MSVKLKFKVSAITELPGNVKSLQLFADHDPDGCNSDFTGHKPIGDIRVEFDTGTLADTFFKPGVSYVVTFDVQPINPPPK